GFGVIGAQTSTAFAAEKDTEISKCVKEKVAAGEQADQCVNAPNPILPAGNELFWGILSFVILLAVMWKLAVPGIKKTMDARTQKISDSLDDAERTKTEAHEVLTEYQRQLADAKAESGRIIEEARQTADAMRRDLMQRAEQDAAAARERGQADINAMVERAR